MRILIIGGTDPTYMLNYITNIKKCRKDAIINILDFSSNKSEDAVFTDLGIKIIRADYESKPSLVSRLIRFSKYIDIFRNLEEYDICHVHYINWLVIPFIKRIKRKCRKIVSTVYGSDFYRSSKRIKRMHERLYDASDTITVGTETTKREFNQYYNNRYDGKIKVASFGSAPLSILKELDCESKEASKKKLDIPDDRIIITCGYSGSEAHQHIKIIKSIAQLQREILDRIYIILPMTYAVDPQYNANIRALLEEHSIDYIIYDKFIDLYTIARLRKVTDIMIQLQTTDQFSASMMEYLYAKSILITGTWLPYDFIERKGIKMIRIDLVDAVGETAGQIVGQLEKYKAELNLNPGLVWDMISWEKNIGNWINIYELLLKEG